MAAKAIRRASEDRVLPPEIWSDILNRLPTKSILQCRSVCKSWYSLVSCPSFISDYSTRNLNKNSNHVLLQLYDDRSHVCSFSSHDESFIESREHDDLPVPFLGKDLRIVGSCSGLICLSKCGHDESEVTFLIWNPNIRKVVELPSRTITSPNFSYFGFGFDSKTNDHKVLCLCTDLSDVLSNVCEIYDLSKGVWRGISPLMRAWKVWGRAPECYLNGAVHWTGYRDGISRDRILLSFNMSDEIFREIRLFDCAEFTWNENDDDAPFINTRSVTFGGLIHVIVWEMQRGSCSVWAMKEYGVVESWTKLFNINICESDFPTYQPYSFCLRENDEILMVHDYSILVDVYEGVGDLEDLVLYDNRRKTSKRLFSFDKHVSNVCLYEESLYLM